MRFRLILVMILSIAIFSSCSKEPPPEPPLAEKEIYNVRIETIPEGGEIYIGDDSKGTAPVNVDMTLDQVLDVRARKGELISTGEQIINFEEENRAKLTVFLAEVSDEKYAGSKTEMVYEECKTARSIARGEYGAQVDYSNIGTIYFEFDKAELTEEAMNVLDELAPHIAEAAQSGMVIAIEGHTDSTGEEGYNEKLSNKRVAAVLSYLLKHPDYQIPPKNLWAKGYGEDCPIADNTTKAGEAQNRRTDITLLPLRAYDELPEDQK